MDLIKGLGGALLREKIVAQASARFVVIVDSAKEVGILGERSPVPVEVLPYAWSTHLSYFQSLGARPVPRRLGDELVRTDNGNYLVDLWFSDGIHEPESLDVALRSRAGVLETGLFLQMADIVLVGTTEDVRTRERAHG